jgi:fatty-acyl-CoA synthase
VSERAGGQWQSIASALRRAYESLLSVEILRRRGLMHPLRLDESLHTLRVARRAGPFAAMILHPARHAARDPAIVDARGTLTYGELEMQANALARGLLATGIRPGDRVGILCRDHHGMVLALIAASRLGARVVLMNTGFAKPQFVEVIQREQVSAMLLDSEFVALTEALPRETPRVLTWVDSCADGDPTIPTLEDLMARRSTAAMPLPARPGGLVLLTSGTTGTPRGAFRERVSPLQSAQLLDRIPLSRGGAMIIAAPLFHGTGLAQLVLAMALGKKVVLQQLKFVPEATLAHVAAHRADALVLVPTMLQRMIDLDPSALAQHDTSSLKIIVCAGSALSPDLCRRTADTFGDVLYNVYGSTEVANTAVATPAELRRAPGTVGRPPLGCRLAIYDERRNRVTATDTSGTIFAANGLSFSGYTDGTRKEIVDGMLCTGDVGHVDEAGLLFVDGRQDEMIVSGGENVFPLEVENLLAGRPDVRDVAVVGVADREFGERLRAFIVPHPDAKLDTQVLAAYVKANLARYKVPRDIVFVAEIPRNANGKLLRKQLEQVD